MKYFYRLVLSTLILSVTLADVVFSQKLKSDSWGVVYSSDISVQEAKPEIIQLPRLFPEYKNQNRLFKYRNFYVSVVLFPSKKDAIDAKAKISQKYSREVFEVNIKNWCSSDWTNPKYTKVGIIDCNKVEIASNKTGAIRRINEQIKDLATAKSALNTVKDKLDRLINTGQNSAFINIEQYVTIFRKGNFFYIAVINYADLSAAEKAVGARPPANFYDDFAPVDLKEWCGTYKNKPNKNGYIQCEKSK